MSLLKHKDKLQLFEISRKLKFNCIIRLENPTIKAPLKKKIKCNYDSLYESLDVSRKIIIIEYLLLAALDSMTATLWRYCNLVDSCVNQ